mgnify:CR=1 FL=1
MLIRLFYILFFGMILFGVSGFILNSTEAGLAWPHDLYQSIVGGQGMVTPDSSAQKKVKANRTESREYFANIRVQQDRLRDQMRDLRSKISGFRDADKARRQEADTRLNTFNQRNDENIRRQQDRIRDLQQMARNRMSRLRNQR